jgi:Trehalose and maltose hydrolases (possible phosphorylases)
MVENESIVNLPDWQSIAVRVDGGEWLDVDTMAVSDYVQELDLRRGMLLRRFTVTDDSGRRTAVAQRRLVSMADPYLAGLEATFVALNWSGRLEISSGVDGRVRNGGVARYRGPATSISTCSSSAPPDPAPSLWMWRQPGPMYGCRWPRGTACWSTAWRPMRRPGRWPKTAMRA